MLIIIVPEWLSILSAMMSIRYGLKVEYPKVPCLAIFKYLYLDRLDVLDVLVHSLSLKVLKGPSKEKGFVLPVYLLLWASLLDF